MYIALPQPREHYTFICLDTVSPVQFPLVLKYPGQQKVLHCNSDCVVVTVLVLYYMYTLKKYIHILKEIISGGFWET